MSGLVTPTRLNTATSPEDVWRYFVLASDDCTSGLLLSPSPLLPHTIPTPATQSIPLPLIEKSKKATGALSRETALLIGSEIGIRSTHSPTTYCVAWLLTGVEGGSKAYNIIRSDIVHHPPLRRTQYRRTFLFVHQPQAFLPQRIGRSQRMTAMTEGPPRTPGHILQLLCSVWSNVEDNSPTPTYWPSQELHHATTALRPPFLPLDFFSYKTVPGHIS